MLVKFFDKQKSTIYSFTSNIVYTFAIWMTALMINHYFGAKSLGEYSFIQAVISPLALFFRLQLKVLATLESNIINKFSQYLNLFVLSESLFLFVIIILGFILNQELLFYSFAIFKVFESLHMLIQGYYQSKNNFFQVFIISLTRSLVMLIVLWSFLSEDIFLFYSFLLISFIWFIIFLFFDIPKIKANKVKFHIVKNFKSYRALIIAGASLSIVSCLDTLNVAIPRYFIKGYYDEIDLGKFTMVLQFFVASTIFVVSVGHPFLVKLKYFVRKKDMSSFIKQVKKTSFVFLFFSILIITFFVLTSAELMSVFWGEEYRYLGKYLVISMLGIIPLFLSSILVYSITALKYYSLHLKYYPIVILFSIIFSWILVPVYGILGGVIVIVLTQLVRFICVFFAFRYCLTKEKYILKMR